MFVLELPPTKRACGQVGDLKLVHPNVRRYKLLMFNYLQMFNRFPSAETNVQKNYQSSITSVSPHLPQTHVGRSYFLSTVMPLLFNNSIMGLTHKFFTTPYKLGIIICNCPLFKCCWGMKTG